jgi:mono/diheme cytochrome c family protein
MRTVTIAMVLTLIGGAAAAAPPGSPEAGQELARTWCGNCHTLPGATRASDQVPPLAAAVAGRSADQLSAFLARPHPPMPPLQLSRPEIADLVAYLRDLPRSP